MTEAPLWNEDPQFWITLDELVASSWMPFKAFLEAVQKHDDEFNIVTQAILFGGLGNFMRVYSVSRGEGLTPTESFNKAVATIGQDSRVLQVMQQGANRVVDSKVEAMKEGEE